jgi:hypothetical protein
MSTKYPTNHYQHLGWEDLPNCAAIITPLIRAVDKASIHVAGREAATLLLFRGALEGMVTYRFNSAPDDMTLIVVRRVVAAHQQACREGRRILCRR